MGGAPEEEHVLIVIPFEQPEGVVEDIERRHPHVKVRYRNLALGKTLWTTKNQVAPGGSFLILYLLGTHSPAVQRCDVRPSELVVPRHLKKQY